MKKTVFMGLICGAIAATMIISSGTSNLAIATSGNPNTDDPDRWGEVTSGAAQEDGKTNLGEHSSSFAPGKRSGLANILDQDKPEGDAGGDKHPSKLADAICSPGVPGC